MKSKTKISNFYCDVLIIGSGSAGLRAAIEAHDAGAHVLIISRSKKGDPHTVLARGGLLPVDIHGSTQLAALEFLKIMEKVLP